MTRTAMTTLLALMLGLLSTSHAQEHRGGGREREHGRRARKAKQESKGDVETLHEMIREARQEVRKLRKLLGVKERRSEHGEHRQRPAEGGRRKIPGEHGRRKYSAEGGRRKNSGEHGHREGRGEHGRREHGEHGERRGEHGRREGRGEHGEHREGRGEHGRRTGRGEHRERDGEHGKRQRKGRGEHGRGGHGEEGGRRLSKTEIWNEIRNGAQVILGYSEADQSFQGIVRNTTKKVLKGVRVEVHLSNGVELGPTKRTDLKPGQTIRVELSAANQKFTWWTTHPEHGDEEHGHGHDHEHGAHRRDARPKQASLRPLYNQLRLLNRELRTLTNRLRAREKRESGEHGRGRGREHGRKKKEHRREHDRKRDR